MSTFTHIFVSDPNRNWIFDIIELFSLQAIRYLHFFSKKIQKYDFSSSRRFYTTLQENYINGHIAAINKRSMQLNAPPCLTKKVLLQAKWRCQYIV
jgi:hypothetical protein